MTNAGDALGSHPSFDMMVVDLRLPGMSGLDSMDKIRSEDPYKSILVVTAHRDLKEELARRQLDCFPTFDKSLVGNEID